jgi:tight adherence protein C
MEILVIVYIMLFGSAWMVAYELSNKRLSREVHLPDEIKGDNYAVESVGLLGGIAQFLQKLIEKGNIPIEDVKRKLISAGKPVTEAQFFAVTVALTVALPAVTFVVLRPKDLTILFIPLAFGFMYPNFWLGSKVKNRQGLILRELPHVIDLLNICVGAGLDFMVAVTRVTQGFRSSPLIDEFNTMLKEIQMGSSRRVALKNLAVRINSPEISSFVRTLLQADKMGTPIAEALKMQAEEVRFRRFQRGEEQGLKAPIKLLFPLLFFILPVVMIIVAGPILIQFTRGGGIKM